MLPVFQNGWFWMSFLAVAFCVGLLRPVLSSATAKPFLFLAAQAALLLGSLRLPYRVFLLWLVATGLSYGLIKSKIRYAESIIWIFWLGILILVRNHVGFERLPFLAVGHSYLALRCLSFATDYNTDRITKSSLLTFWSYLFFVSSFVAGPIDRYPRFASDLTAPHPLSAEKLLAALARIAIGSFKKIVLASLFFHWALARTGNLEWRSLSPFRIWIGFYAYAWYIYLDFSGYSDMAIGSGLLFGITLPENFEWPYFRRDIFAFWSSWHMSLTHWLRDYLFLPIGQRLVRLKSISLTPLSIAALCYGATMLFCGFWHGLAAHYLLWGLYHGVGLTVYKGVQMQEHPPASTRLQKHLPWLSTVLTFHFVAFGWLLFIYDAQDVPPLILKMMRIGQ